MSSTNTYAPSFGLNGKVALVTGASRGIGYGLARALAEAGASVAVSARDESALSELASHLPGSLVVPMDLRDVESIRAGVARVEQHFGRLDILVNNAGLGANHPALEVTEQDWDELMEVNLKGLFFCSQAAARGMLARGYGRIVNLSSQAAVVGIVDHAVYCASKGGVNQLTRVMALEWSKHGVTVNAVGPTFIYTPGTAERLDDPEYRANVLRRIPANRIGDISDVAGAVIYLASDAAKLVSGTCLLVDGGWTAQ
ncbi:MAG: SDR family oxidoreductase [Myxococcales bacterium]|nr:MAG: SDR family oxidoreductase [Myxococcales bacterium]